jgi:hypothetical protein
MPSRNCLIGQNKLLDLTRFRGKVCIEFVLVTEVGKVLVSVLDMVTADWLTSKQKAVTGWLSEVCSIKQIIIGKYDIFKPVHVILYYHGYRIICLLP